MAGLWQHKAASVVARPCLHQSMLLQTDKSVRLSSSSSCSLHCQQEPPWSWGVTGIVWQKTWILLVGSQAPASMVSIMACCHYRMHWACMMSSGSCIQQPQTSPTQPPQVALLPGWTVGLSVTACSRPSAQLQSQTQDQVTTMVSPCPFHQPRHPHMAQVCGRCQLSSCPTLPFRPS